MRLIPAARVQTEEEIGLRATLDALEQAYVTAIAPIVARLLEIGIENPSGVYTAELDAGEVWVSPRLDS